MTKFLKNISKFYDTESQRFLSNSILLIRTSLFVQTTKYLPHKFDKTIWELIWVRCYDFMFYDFPSTWFLLEKLRIWVFITFMGWVFYYTDQPCTQYFPVGLVKAKSGINVTLVETGKEMNPGGSCDYFWC